MSNVPFPTKTQAPDLEDPPTEIDAKVGQSLDEVIAAHEEQADGDSSHPTDNRGVKADTGAEREHLKKSVSALDDDGA